MQLVIGPTKSSGHLPNLNLVTCDGQHIQQYSDPNNPNHPTTPTYMQGYDVGAYNVWDMPNFNTGAFDTHVWEIDPHYVTDGIKTLITMATCEDATKQNCWNQLVEEDHVNPAAGRVSGTGGRNENRFFKHLSMIYKLSMKMKDNESKKIRSKKGTGCADL